MVHLRRILLVLLLAVPWTFSAFGQPGGCHCFRERTFNPADRHASDAYLLTTVFNSLTAGYFSIAKKQIVMLKMKGGVGNEDLLIALYIAGLEGMKADDLLAGKKDGTWQAFLAENPPAKSFRHDELYNLIIEGVPDREAAEMVTRRMLSHRFGITAEAIGSLQRQDFSLREIALINTLAEYVRTDPAGISSQYREKGLSWSEIAHNFGLQPADVGRLAGEKAPGSS